MSLKVLERKLNRDLRAVNRDYSVTNLKQLPNGEYWFDLAIPFKPRDLERVNKIFKQHLGTER